MQVMETRKRVLGPEHPDTLTSMANLAYTWKARGKLQDSLALMRRCSEVCNKVIGPNHPLTRSSSRAVSDWKNEHSTAANRASPPATTQTGILEDIQEVS